MHQDLYICQSVLHWQGGFIDLVIINNNLIGTGNPTLLCVFSLVCFSTMCVCEAFRLSELPVT